MNGHVRRMFNLESFVVKSNGDIYSEYEVQFLPKTQLMEKLEEFDNLINAMGALFYVSKRMTT